MLKSCDVSNRDPYSANNTNNTNNSCSSNKSAVSDNASNKATGPNFYCKPTLLKYPPSYGSVLSTLHFIDYSNDLDAQNRIIENYARWNSDKNIYELISRPELFASFCSHHNGKKPETMCFLEKERRSYERFRCAIADDLLAKKKDFKIYMVPINDKKVYLQKELESVFAADDEKKIDRRLITSGLLQEICTLADINFSKTSEKCCKPLSYGSYEVKDCDVLNFEWKKDKNPIAMPKTPLEDIMNYPERFADFIDEICGPSIPRNRLAEEKVEELRALLAERVLADGNFKICAIPSHGLNNKVVVLKIENADSSASGFQIDSKMFLWSYVDIEPILKKICELSGRTLASNTYTSGFTVFNLMSKRDPNFKDFKLPDDVYVSYCKLGNHPQNLYEDFLDKNFCDLMVTSREGMSFSMHSSVYERWFEEVPANTRVTFGKEYTAIKPFVLPSYFQGSPPNKQVMINEPYRVVYALTASLYLLDFDRDKFIKKYSESGDINTLIDLLDFAHRIEMETFEAIYVEIICNHVELNDNILAKLRKIDTLMPDMVLARKAKLNLLPTKK